ncbi:MULTISPECIES: pentapeptide repeat-containing protein [unclassified Streptomyces]|uniref:pentapeptide repeat-containing protein n=1 Tax=unclassified Streptomyces TaxID=2593676 RepID=UPI000AD8A660|nr:MULTISPECIES: pentapeptide repeat-containing protein [unclassified Streptomyces]
MVDHRGTPFTQSLLDALLDAVRDPATGQASLGPARFELATFEGGAWFDSATFLDVVGFESATFQGEAWFESATFQGRAIFDQANFEGDAAFESAIFEHAVWFGSATFQFNALFDSATFQGDAGFESVIFQGGATFESATFQVDATFRSATFHGPAWFRSAIFQGRAWFESATFRKEAEFKAASFRRARFGEASFQGPAWFKSATFERGADFASATFQGDADFEAATFQNDAQFEAATFERRVSLGPLVCAAEVWLSGAVFNGPATLRIAARRLVCRRTHWLSTAEVRLRYATVDFTHAVFEYPLTIAAEAAPFVRSNHRELTEQVFAGTPDAAVRIASLRGVDGTHLVLADVDLSGCLFTGTVHLDQVRLEGACSFDTVPPGTHWRHGRPTRFTPRRTLAEEHHWRAAQPAAVRGWNVAVLDAGRPGPTQLAPVYRALRKAFEDSKNEPGAADFYYGEMEMRRHDRATTSRAERGLLHAYWMLSGYGLRALRALGWLAAAMLITLVLLMGFGLPKDDPKQEATGTVPPGGGKVTFQIEKDAPQNPKGNRFTGKRFEKALNGTLNSVVFRSSGQDLTTAGTYIEMTSRLVEPALLALAVLAVRGRIKR